MSYRVVYQRQRPSEDGQGWEPFMWSAEYASKEEAMRQAAYDIGEGTVQHVEDEDGGKVAGRQELRKHARACLEEGLPAFVARGDA
jgi:hypothetical protein